LPGQGEGRKKGGSDEITVMSNVDAKYRRERGKREGTRGKRRSARAPFVRRWGACHCAREGSMGKGGGSSIRFAPSLLEFRLGKTEWGREGGKNL